MIKRTHSFADDDEFEAAVKQLYDDGAAHYAQFWHQPHDCHDEAWQRFTAAVKPAGTMLDVGCNAGTDLLRMVNAGFMATGIDVSEQALQLCQQKCPQARTVMMNMLDLKELNEQFDGVWVAYSLLHIPVRRVHEALTALASTLKPDGVLMMMMSVVEEPQEHLHTSNVMFDANGQARQVPAVHWTAPLLLEVFAEHFEIVWQQCPPMVNGWSAFSLLVKPL